MLDLKSFKGWNFLSQRDFKPERREYFLDLEAGLKDKKKKWLLID